MAHFRQRPFSPPGEQEIAEQMAIGPAELQRALRILVEQQRLVRADQRILFHADAVARAREIVVAHIKKEGRLESVRFKYLLKTTRKYAIPLLDYFDNSGVTRRMGDNTRYLGPLGS